jgi:hypothetical protein
LFAACAVWPDRVRRFEHVRDAAERERLMRRYNRSRWHYINLPTYLSASDRAALHPVVVNDGLTVTAGLPAESFNVVQAVQHLETSWPDQSDVQRAVTLCWLLHLYADLHQPLHATALFSRAAFPAGDRGGNEIVLDKRLNLHGYWDALLGTDRNWAVIQRAAGRTMAQRSAGGEPADWAVEASVLAGADVYTAEVREQLFVKPTHLRLPESYRGNASRVADQQLERAVVRATSRMTNVLLAQMTPLSRSVARSSAE